MMMDHLFSRQEKKVYSSIRMYGPLTPSDIRSTLHLSLPTILKVLKQLEDKRYIVSCEGESSGGRKPLLYTVDPDRFYAFGVLLDPDDIIKVILINLDHKIVDFRDLSSLDQKTPPEHLEDICNAVNELRKKHAPNDERKCIGVGVGSVGPIDIEKGIFLSEKRFPVKGWENTALLDIIEQKTGLPAYINNLARLGLLAHKVAGLAKNSSNAAFIFMHKGIGLGIMIDNQLVSTSSTMTGALDHMVIKYDSDEPPCEICGRRGCLTSIVSEKIMLKNYEAKTGLREDGLTFNSILQAAERGDEAALTVLREAAFPLGLAIVNFMTLALVDLIILSGEVFNRSGLFFYMVKEVIDTQYRSRNNMVCTIAKDNLDPKSTLIGSGVQVFENVF